MIGVKVLSVFGISASWRKSFLNAIFFMAPAPAASDENPPGGVSFSGEPRLDGQGPPRTLARHAARVVNAPQSHKNGRMTASYLGAPRAITMFFECALGPLEESA